MSVYGHVPMRNPMLVGLYQTKRFELLVDSPLPPDEELRRRIELNSLWLQLDYDDCDFADTIPRSEHEELNHGHSAETQSPNRVRRPPLPLHRSTMRGPSIS